MLRGIRGATTAASNARPDILAAAKELLVQLIQENELRPDDIGAVIFSSTPDLNAAFPAAAARELGWSDVPLFGTQEIENPNGVPLCVRVLILWNTEKTQKEIRHAYLRNARSLRPDLAQ